MEARSAVKSFLESFAKWLGEHVAAAAWAAFALGGPIITWLASPTAYSFKLTRLHATARVLAFVLVIAATAWVTRRAITRRRKFHLTPFGQQNVWGATNKLADGTVNVQISAQFMARNLTDSVQRLLVARLLKPRIKGTTLHSLIEGPIGGIMELPADAARRMTVHLLIKSAQELESGDRDAVFEIVDDVGHRERVKVTLRGMIANKTPAVPMDAASTASPAATKIPSP